MVIIGGIGIAGLGVALHHQPCLQCAFLPLGDQNGIVILDLIIRDPLSLQEGQNGRRLAGAHARKQHAVGLIVQCEGQRGGQHDHNDADDDVRFFRHLFQARLDRFPKLLYLLAQPGLPPPSMLTTDAVKFAVSAVSRYRLILVSSE